MVAASEASHLRELMAKRADTSEMTIAVASLVMNLETLLYILLRLLENLRRAADLLRWFVFVRCVSRSASVV